MAAEAAVPVRASEAASTAPLNRARGRFMDFFRVGRERAWESGDAPHNQQDASPRDSDDIGVST